MALGLLLKNHGIYPVESLRFDVENGKNICNNYFHYRIKTNNRNIDQLYMKEIFKLKNKL